MNEVTIKRRRRMKCLTKGVLFVLAMVFGLMLIVTVRTARSETETSLTKDRTLIVKEVKYIGRFPNVPEGISPDTAYQLASGKQTKATVVDENGSNEHSLALPWIKERTEYMDKAVTYEKGEWVVKYAPSRFKNEESKILSILWLWIPAVLIILISAEGAFARIALKEFFTLYGLLIAGVGASAVVGGYVGASSGGMTGGMVGFLFGLICGGLAGLFAGGVIMEEDPGLSVVMGGFAGAFTAMISGAYAGAQEFKIVFHCFLFLIASEAVAFSIVLLIKSAQWKIQKIALNANKNIAT